MLTVQQIADSVDVASREYPLRKVELFGSYANGKNTPQSDVDLLVDLTGSSVRGPASCSAGMLMSTLL